MPNNVETYSFPLGAGEVCPSGTYVLDLESRRCDWSEGLFRIHGFTPGEVVPTLDLIMAHKHPTDREPINQLISRLCKNAGQGALFHRLIDRKGHEHQVLTVVESRCDDAGAVSVLNGLMVDLTRTVAVENGREAAAAVAGAYANRAVIEQAVGILMGQLDINADQAFRLLSQRSQNSNTKLAVVAAALVGAAGSGTIPDILASWGLNETDDHSLVGDRDQPAAS